MEQGTGNKQQGTGNLEHGFRRLRAWQKADNLAVAIFLTSRHLQRQDAWLRDQVCRAAVSVPANIAEGYTRGALKDYLRFLDIARGSLAEVEYYLHFIERSALLPADQLAHLAGLRGEAGALLFALSQSLRDKVRAGGPWQRGSLGEEISDYASIVEE